MPVRAHSRELFVVCEHFTLHAACKWMLHSECQIQEGVYFQRLGPWVAPRGACNSFIVTDNCSQHLLDVYAA